MTQQTLDFFEKSVHAYNQLENCWAISGLAQPKRFAWYPKSVGTNFAFSQTSKTCSSLYKKQLEWIKNVMLCTKMHIYSLFCSLKTLNID